LLRVTLRVMPEPHSAITSQIVGLLGYPVESGFSLCNHDTTLAKAG
jgi:hypothetical protein